MAEIIDKIVKSKNAPQSTNVLWDDGKNLKVYRNGSWENSNNTEIKEKSIPLSALILGDQLLKLFETSYYTLFTISEDNVYYNTEVSFPNNIMYFEATGYDNICELKKGDTVKLARGPIAYLTWDDNGVKISNDAKYYNITCHYDIQLKSSITI